MVKKILMISTNREFAPQPVVPVGAAWVTEALSQAGFTVRMLDLTYENDPIYKVIEVMREFMPDGVGVSVRNVDNGDFLTPRSFIPALKDITDAIKHETDGKILLGGSGVSVMPVEILEYLGLTFAVVGEGEEAAVSFFNNDFERNPYPDIPGLVCRGRTHREYERTDYPATPDIVTPRLDRWVDVKRYLRFEPVLPVQGKRGCANRCLYCTYNRIEGRCWRLRDPAAVAEEISASIINTGCRTYEFVDSIFNQPEGYMETLLEEIIRWNIKAKFTVASMTPKGLTAKQLRLMYRAGVTSAAVTPEAAADKTLTALRKGFTEEEVIRAVELFKDSPIRSLWCFLIGGPGEDETTVGKTVAFINKYLGGKDKAFITNGIRIYPQTPMHKIAIRDGIVSPDDSLLMPTFYYSPAISPEHVRCMLKNGLNSHSSSLFLSDTSFTSLGTLRLIGTALHLPHPFWRYAGYMNLMNKKNRVIYRSWDKADKEC